MQTKNITGNGKIVVVKNGIYVSHKGEELTFGFPIIGPDYFSNVMGKIDGEKLSRPTTAQTLCLVDLALKNPDEKHCKDILSKLRNDWFWTSTENLWGEDDVIVYDNVDGKMPSRRKDLIKRYKDGDKAVRIVPYWFKTEIQSMKDLLKNPYVIAQVGDKNMLDVVRRVAEGLGKKDSSLCTLNPTQDDDVKGKRYTTLNSYLDGGRLVLDSDCGHLDMGGCASGVYILTTAQNK